MVFQDAFRESLITGRLARDPVSKIGFCCLGKRGNLKRECFDKRGRVLDPIPTGLTLESLLSDRWEVDDPKPEGPTLRTTFDGFFEPGEAEYRMSLSVLFQLDKPTTRRMWLRDLL